MDNVKFNKCQTPLEELGLERQPQEVQEQFWDFLNNVPFIRWMVSPDRPLVSELPRDEFGKAIIDITKPPILEHTDFFRQSAITFKETGQYTHLRPNRNPQSDFGKWIREERRRSWDGLVDPDTGMWIGGDQYYFLNYSPMQLIKQDKSGKKVRVVDFPNFWDGHFLVDHYLYMARQEGHHAAMLSSRGKGKSFKGASMLAKRYTLGESSEVRRKVQCVVTAADRKYIYGANQILNMFCADIDFTAVNTQFAAHRLIDSAQSLNWVSGYKDKETGVRMGSGNSVMGITSGDDQSKLNGTRGQLYLIEEAGIFKDLLSLYQMIRPSVEDGKDVYGLIYMYGTAGDDMSDFTALQEIMYNPKGYNMLALPNVYDKEGQGRKEFTLFFPAYLNRSSCMDEDGNSDVTKALLEILVDRYTVKYNSTDINAITKRISQYPITPQEAIVRSHGSIFPVTELNERLTQIDNNPGEYDDTYIGELVEREVGKIEFRPTNDIPIREFPTKDNKVAGAMEIFQMPQKDSKGDVFPDRYYLSCLREGEKVNTLEGLKVIEDITLEDKLININGKPVDIIRRMCHSYDGFTYTMKLAGIYDTTTFTWNHPIYCSTPERHYRHATTCKRTGLPERYFTYNFEFKNAEDVCIGDVVKSPNLYLKELSETEILNKWVDNSRIDWKVSNPLLKEDFWWLLGLIIGDGWTCEKSHSIHICFNSKEVEYIKKAEDIINSLFNRKFTICKNEDTCIEKCFSCRAFNDFIVKEIGKGAENKQLPEWIKYIPHHFKKQLVLGYLASDGCISKIGAEFVSASKKLICDFQDILFSLGIISNVTKLRDKKISVISGRECNVLEAYHLRVGNTYLKNMIDWNPDDLKLKKATITYNDSHRRQDIFFSEDCKYIYFRVKDVKKEHYKGNVYNFECDTHTYMCNYVPTHNCDPYDDDASNTMSLGSILVLDLWTDKIVAEYTGRPMFADDFYEIARKMCFFWNGRLMYENNKKGLFAYFSKRNCVYKLADTPEYLKDKQLIKEIGYGNKGKGIPMYSGSGKGGLRDYGFRLIKDWLLHPTTVIEKDESGKEIETQIPNLYHIKNRALLKELILYNPDINVDRIMSLLQLMLYREEKMILYQGDVRNHEVQSSGMEADDYWTRNYPGKKSSKF